MFLGEVIKQYREEKGMSQQTFADKCGLSKAYISQLENNKNPKTGEPMIPSPDTFVKVAAAMRISLKELLEMVDENQPVSLKATVPLYDVAAGPGYYNAESASEYLDDEVPEEGYSYARVHGDSMLPILHDGDIVKVKHQSETDPQDFSVVQVNGDESTVKHVEIVDNGVWLRAENKEVYPDRFYSIQEVMALPVRIIGKAVEVRRML